jgi:hypothetical protein
MNVPLNAGAVDAIGIGNAVSSSAAHCNIHPASHESDHDGSSNEESPLPAHHTTSPDDVNDVENVQQGQATALKFVELARRGLEFHYNYLKRMRFVLCGSQEHEHEHYKGGKSKKNLGTDVTVMENAVSHEMSPNVLI